MMGFRVRACACLSYVKLSPQCPEQQVKTTRDFAATAEADTNRNKGFTDDPLWVRDVVGEDWHNALVDGYTCMQQRRLMYNSWCGLGV